MVSAGWQNGEENKSRLFVDADQGLGDQWACCELVTDELEPDPEEISRRGVISKM